MKKGMTPVFALAVLTLFAVGAVAQDEMYEITVTNLSPGQVVTPPLLASHSGNYTLFEPGKKASRALATLAETGDTAPLAQKVGKSKRVMEVVTGDAVIMPGNSATFTIMGGGDYSYLSFASMFALTNDAFAALRGVKLSDGAVYYANVYDAGSEANTESADHVPALGGTGRSTANAEGFIHIAPGVHGGADLDPATHDWRNPGVMITIKKVQ